MPDIYFIRPCGFVVLLCFIVSWTCVVVSVIIVCVFSCPYVCLWCVYDRVCKSLSAFARCLGEVIVFSLKSVLVCLFAKPCIVFQ